jgi:methylthioribulose-1-phosphate dehydratase
MICDLSGQAIDPECRPSAETPLHARLYQLDDSVGAVLHTHSIASTLLSRRCGSLLKISGFEMQKALAGVKTHQSEISIPVYDNDQDMHALADVVENAWSEGAFTVPGFLIRGHGLYAWGRNAEEAERHIEGFEFLFECLWQESMAQRS